MKRKKKIPEEKYSVTLKGLISTVTNHSEEIYDAIELYGFRNGVNAVVLKDGGIFTEVELHETDN